MPKNNENNGIKIKFKKIWIKLTLVDDDLCFRDVFVCEWDDLVVVVSVGIVVVAVVPDEFVMWSAGNDSGTVCSVDLIVADISLFVFAFTSSILVEQFLFFLCILCDLIELSFDFLFSKYKSCCQFFVKHIHAHRV